MCTHAVHECVRVFTYAAHTHVHISILRRVITQHTCRPITFIAFTYVGFTYRHTYTPIHVSHIKNTLVVVVSFRYHARSRTFIIPKHLAGAVRLTAFSPALSLTGSRPPYSISVRPVRWLILKTCCLPGVVSSQSTHRHTTTCSLCACVFAASVYVFFFVGRSRVVCGRSHICASRPRRVCALGVFTNKIRLTRIYMYIFVSILNIYIYLIFRHRRECAAASKQVSELLQVERVNFRVACSMCD